MIDDGLAMDTERGADNAKGAYWIPAAGNSNEITVSLPRLLYLPTELVRFCVERPRMGEDLFRELGRLVGEQIVAPEDAKLVFQWCLAAMQLEPTKSNQVLLHLT